MNTTPQSAAVEKLQSENQFAPVTDLTLVLGAESYLHSLMDTTGSACADPEALGCLIDFIDLAVNADCLHLPLPAGELGGWPRLTKELSPIICQLPRTGTSTPRVQESALAKNFGQLLDDKGEEWLVRWLKFQFHHPIVGNHPQSDGKAGHRARIPTRISPEGRDAWESVCNKTKLKRAVNTLFMKNPRGFSHLTPEVDELRLHTLGEMLLCYAYDVFRRGWDYADRCSKTTDASYHPHVIRRYALDASPQWRNQPERATQLWSWGTYLAHVIKNAHAKGKAISPETVAEQILQIRDAMQKTGCPRMQEVRSPSPAFSKRLKQIIDETAYKARLPLLLQKKPPKESETIREGFLAALETGAEVAVHEIGAIVPGAIFLIRLVSHRLPDAVTYPIRESSKRVVSRVYQKIQFERPGLFAEHASDELA